jgi:hypothetical protein
MKRECLLAKTYTGPPMILDGTELFYSPLANEIVREFQTAFFCGEGTGDQTAHHGLCEGILIMWLIAKNQFAEIDRLRNMSRPERHKLVLDFMLRHADVMDELKDQLIERVNAAMAAGVESEAQGKPLAQAPECLPLSTHTASATDSTLTASCGRGTSGESSNSCM